MAESQQVEGNNTPGKHVNYWTNKTHLAKGKEISFSPQEDKINISKGGGYCSKISEHHLAEKYEEVTKKAARTGYDILRDGRTAIDAVEAAVSVFEESDYFNAGCGSALNCHGEVECDAMIMDGNTMGTGAVMAARRFINPVKLARKVMDKSGHCALSGDGTLEFAREIRFPICNPKNLKGKNPNQNLDVGTEHYGDFVKIRYFGEPVKESQSCDTVSAVAMDNNGYLACASSSGGIAGKRKGRVGDVPLVGCGGYANEHGAAATTGHGESIMKMTLARSVVYKMEHPLRLNAQESSEKALKEMKDRVNGSGGVIAIDKDGNFGIDYNTTVMVWACIKDGKLKFGMKSADEAKSELADI